MTVWNKTEIFDENDPGKWPEIIREKTYELINLRPLWKDAFKSAHERGLANEAQSDQCIYPFEDVMLAKVLCDLAGDHPHLFFRYMSKAGNILNPKVIESYSILVTPDDEYGPKDRSDPNIKVLT
jgi:hypothetical protein